MYHIIYGVDIKDPPDKSPLGRDRQVEMYHTIYGVDINDPPDKNYFHGDLRKFGSVNVRTGFSGIRVQKFQTKSTAGRTPMTRVPPGLPPIGPPPSRTPAYISPFWSFVEGGQIRKKNPREKSCEIRKP